MQHDPLEVIFNYGLSTTSQASAITTIKEQLPFKNWSGEEYVQAMTLIVGHGLNHRFKSLQDCKYTFLYLVQNVIRTVKAYPDALLDMENLFWITVKESDAFQKANQIALSLEEGGVQPDEEGGVKRRAGSKTEKAYAIYCENVDKEDARKLIIAAFKDELEMSNGGATTYFHNMKKLHNKNNQ